MSVSDLNQNVHSDRSIVGNTETSSLKNPNIRERNVSKNYQKFPNISTNLSDRTKVKSGIVATENTETVFKNIDLKNQTNLSGSISKESEGSPKIYVLEPAVQKPLRNMDKALDTLLKIESYLSNNAKKGLNFETDSAFFGKLKNLFCKFLGFFSKTFEEERTQVLNAKIDAVFKNVKMKIKKQDEFGKSLYHRVILPIMRDKTVSDELKLTCFKTLGEGDMEFKRELFNNVRNQWLLPLMNDKNADEKRKMEYYRFFDDDCDIQTLLFKSLKEPSKNIREAFWKSYSNSIAVIFDVNPTNLPGKEWMEDAFLTTSGNPLTEIMFYLLENNPNLDPDYFEQDIVLDCINTKEDLRRFFKIHAQLMTRKGYMDQIAKKTFDEFFASKKWVSITQLEGKINNFYKLLSDGELDQEVLEQCDCQLFSDLYRGDSSVTFSFSGGQKIQITSVDCITEDGEPSQKAFIETIRKQIKSQKLTQEEIKRLADFIALSPGQGYLAPVKSEVGVKEHTFQLQVEFQSEKTNVILPLDRNNVSFKSRFSSIKNGFLALSEKFGADYDDVLDSLPVGQYMHGEMKISCEGKTLLNGKETTEFKDFKLEVPKF